MVSRHRVRWLISLTGENSDHSTLSNVELVWSQEPGLKLKSRPEGIGAGELGVTGRVAQGFLPPELPEPWGHSLTPGSPFLHPKKKDKNPYLYNRRIKQVCCFLLSDV